MIAYIEGNIAHITPTTIVLEVGGIGYSISITLADYDKLLERDSTKLFISEIIREDAYLLFGFLTIEQRLFFEKLISVNGVGPQTAQLILSQFTPAELTGIINSGSVDLLKTVKGIGLKTAQRIVVDLKGKLDLSDTVLELPKATNFQMAIYEDAVRALKTLGYQEVAVKKIVKQLIADNHAIELSELIRIALKQL